MFLDDPLISNIIFYPRSHAIPSRLDEKTKILKFEMADGVLIGGFFFQNDPKLPTILLFHGNGELAIEYQHFRGLFFQCGVNLAAIDFRGYGFSSGDPRFSKLYEDAFVIYEHFVDWIKSQGLNQSVFVLGRSLGSTCAAEIGSHNPSNLKGIIFESGIGSSYRIMTQLFNVNVPEAQKDLLKEWSNDIRATKFQKPTLIIHGTNDWIVDPEHATILFEAVPSDVQKKLVMIKGAGHNDIFQFEGEYFGALKEFIQKNK